MKTFLITLMFLVLSTIALSVADSTTLTPESSTQINLSSVPGQNTTTEEITTSLPITTTKEQTTTKEPETTSVTEPATTVPTTAAPTPETPKAGSWYVLDTDQTSCIRMDMGVRLAITYEKMQNENGTIDIDIPANASALGDCKEQVIELYWPVQKNTWNMSFIFNKTNSNRFYVTLIKFNYIVDNTTFPNASIPEPPKPIEVELKSPDDNLFNGPVGNSYMCKSHQKLEMEGVEANIYNLQVEAYMTKHANATMPPVFGEAVECPGDLETNNIVPIAVGAALAALVVIVLIAYLISRNRSKRGYESV